MFSLFSLRHLKYFLVHFPHRTEEAKEEWLDALFEATQDYCKKRNTLKLLDSTNNIGKEKPVFESSDSAQSCREDNCFNTFSFFKKGVNCKACGKVGKAVCHNIFRNLEALFYNNQ